MKKSSGAELSKNSAPVSKARSLQQKKFRKQFNHFLVEGESTIYEGLMANRIIEIFYTDEYENNKKILDIATERSIPTYLVSQNTLKTISDVETQSGIIATANIADEKIDYKILTNYKKIIFLDAVRDPGNAGTIIRTAAAFGIDCVIFSEDSVDPYNPKTVRSTTGSIFHIPIYLSSDLSSISDCGFQIFFTDAKGEVVLNEVDTAGKQVWVFSNEAHGTRLSHKSSIAVKIPMKSSIESLNVAQAATVIMFYLTSKI